MKSKRGLIKSVFATLLVTVLMFLSVPGTARAVETGYNYYRVQPGDYLWIIGWKFETTVDAIMKANGLSTTLLMPNQVLKIPVSTGYVRELPQTAKYTVKQGDTLNTLGEKFGVSAKSLMDTNKLGNLSLFPGQGLNIPLKPQQRYVIQSGDSLYLIAQKFKANLELLKLVNQMNSTVLWVGQVLFVPAVTTTEPGGAADQPESPTSPEPNPTDPVPEPTPTIPAPEPNPAAPTPEPAPATPEPEPVREIPYGGEWGDLPSGILLYKVQPGDNLWSIANRFKTTIAAIKATNHLHSDLLNINQPLFIPENSSLSVSIPYPRAAQKEGYGELMDWQYTYWILDTGNIASLQDLATGKSFTVRRLGGSNHADMEPLTAADTAIMKEIFGGQWSWERRAVLVRVDGKVIAGSMAGMPHDVQTITDNQFMGHFDLHFLNSRTHNTNSIDVKHQEMVLKAAGN